MRCGKISVEGEAEEISPSPMSRSRRKRTNFYSSTGLDKFERICAELSAKREYIAKKTGSREAQVKFTDSNNRWIPVVVRAREAIGKEKNGVGAARASISGPADNNNGDEEGESLRSAEGNDIHGRSGSSSICVLADRSQNLVITWSRFLVFVILCLSAICVRSSAAATAVIAAVGISYFAVLLRNPRSPNPSSQIGTIAEQKHVNKLRSTILRPDLNVSTASSTLKAHAQQNDFLAIKPKNANDKLKHHKQLNSKAKIDRTILSINGGPNLGPARPARRFDHFYRKTGPDMAYEATVGSIVMMITLFCFVFYGRLSAILLLLYLFPMFKKTQIRTT